MRACDLENVLMASWSPALPSCEWRTCGLKHEGVAAGVDSGAGHHHVRACTSALAAGAGTGRAWAHDPTCTGHRATTAYTTTTRRAQHSSSFETDRTTRER